MLTTLLQSLGLARATTEPVFHQRQINLSGNKITFSMPGDFSRNFMGAHLVKAKNLNDVTTASGYRGSELLRYSWDFKSDSFFKKYTGTLVLLLTVKKIPDGCQKNLAHPLEFVEVLQQSLHEHFAGVNQVIDEDYRFTYSKLFNDFNESIINRHRWIRYGSMRQDGKELATHYVAPITPSHYFVAEFASLSADTIDMRTFTLNYTNKFTDKIINTFDISYAAGNSLVQDIQQCKNLRLEQLIEELSPTGI